MPDGMRRVVIVSRDSNTPEERRFNTILQSMMKANPELVIFTLSGIMAAVHDRDEAVNSLLMFLAGGRPDDSEFFKLARLVMSSHVHTTIEGWNGHDAL